MSAPGSVQVSLGRLDLAVAESVYHRLQVSPSAKSHEAFAWRKLCIRTGNPSLDFSNAPVGAVCRWLGQPEGVGPDWESEIDAVVPGFFDERQ